MAFAWLNGSSDADARPAYNRSFYLYGTFDVVDSAGVWLPNLTLPQRVAAGAPVNMSVVGCNLYSNDSFVHVNTTTRLAVREEVANMSASAYWESYGPLAAVKAEEDWPFRMLGHVPRSNLKNCKYTNICKAATWRATYQSSHQDLCLCPVS